MTVALDCVGLAKTLGGKPVLNGLDLRVHTGEIVSLLGASGSGKSTLLRIIAGLSDPEAGTLSIAGREVWSASKQVPAESRQIGLVFQDYALWPHLTVEANVSFGLKQRGLKPADIRGRVDHSLRVTQLTGLSARFPPELSGGQQQRVAIARCLAAKPALILFDEPMSNLDEALREDLRIEMVSLVRAEGMTAIYVTHDQSEALAVSDRIAVMRAGGIAQLDQPKRLYDHPADAFVAGFLGGFSLLKGHAENGRFTPNGLPISLLVADPRICSDVNLVVRPEDARPDNAFPQSRMIGKVLATSYQGRCWRVLVSIGEHRVKLDWAEALAPGADLAFSLPPERCTLVPETSEACYAKGGLPTASLP